MSKSIVLEIPEAEAADLEAGLDELLSELRKLDQQGDPTLGSDQPVVQVERFLFFKE